MKKLLKIIVITGPTASGKSKIAIELAHKIDAEIICADSRSVYIDFDIVSAKPTLIEQKGIKHHLLDIISPNERFSAGDFVHLAREKIDEIHKKAKNVIICGGTWFYIKALLDKKAMPLIAANYKLREELNLKESAELWNELYILDKKRALEIEKNNKDKIIRSIEMCKTINSPISEFIREDNDILQSIWFMPKIEREELYERINKRVELMINSGLRDEFERNVKKYGIDNEIIKNTIGYSEFIDYSNITEAIDKIKQHTRNFAKRQMTYFRGNNNIKPIVSVEDVISIL